MWFENSLKMPTQLLDKLKRDEHGRLIDCREGYFNSGGWKVFVRKTTVGRKKERNLERNEFPDGLNLQGKLKRFLLTDPGNPRQDLPGPPAQNSPKLEWGKENEFRPNCHFGDKLNKATSVATEQKSIPEIS